MLKSFLHRPQRLWWRRALFQIHLWAGVIFGLYFIAIGISGSALVFEREMMDDAPTLPDEPPPAKLVPYATLLETARQSNPAYALQSIDMRSRQRRVVTMTFKNGHQRAALYFDSYTGKIVARSEPGKNHAVLTFLERLHNELLSGQNGAVANGIGALLLALMCLSGIILWWPGKRIWTRALAVNWRAKWPRINFDLHSAVGFWTLLFVAMWAITGAYFIFPSVIQKPLHLFVTPPAAPHSNWKPADPLLPLDSYLERASQAVPLRQLSYVYMDVFRPHGQVSVFLSRDPAVPLTLQEDIVYLDPSSAHVLWIESSDHWSPAERILMACYSIHFGDFAGLPSKLLWAFIGLALPLLTITGYLMWWNRLLKKKWKLYFPRLQSEPTSHHS